MSFSVLRTTTLSVFLTAALMACSSGPKAPVDSTANPAEETTKLERDINAAYEAQYDILAPRELEQSQKHLTKAKESLKDNDKQSKVLEQVAISRGYLDSARGRAEGRGEQMDGLMKARKAALDAGARNHGKHSDRLAELDKDFRKYAARPETMDSREFGELQSDYLKLERSATQATQLGSARAKVEGAIRDGAKRKTPRTLERAKQDLASAENIIASNVHNPSNYRMAVEKANNSANFLIEVLSATKSGRNTLPETAAIDIVNKNRQLNTLNTELSDTKQDLSTVEGRSAEKDREIASQQQLLTSASSAMALDQALKSAAKDFSKDEAEVFRQGDSLLIRLKAVNFPSGRSDLPAASLPVLAKVKNIAAELKASQVVVEGHTDSTGSSSVNKALSEKRAEAVASYLENNGVDKDAIQTVGYGFTKPLTSDKTKTGRASNRRVDILITPSAQASNTDGSTMKNTAE